MDDERDIPAKRKSVEFAGVAAAVATLLCLFVGEAAEQFANFQSPPHQAATAQANTRFNSIDYATTAALKGQTTVVIGPCDAHTP